ncbi:MAG: hypothetical protein LUD71_03025 [Clostridiales bacterium]|nr:hypothetical protein [Clostridiales bacterium]
MAEFAKIDISGVEELQQRMNQYGSKSGSVIQEYLKVEGFERIASHIPGLIHASGRTWPARKTRSATAAGYNTVFQGITSSLTLTVSTKTRYNYLYFPDDGSNTVHHVGNQQFMLRGAEQATDDIVNGILNRLVAAFES